MARKEKARREGGDIRLHHRHGGFRESAFVEREPRQVLDTGKVARIARDVVRAQVPKPILERVITEPAVDSQGKDALRITLVIKPQAVRKLTGKQAIGVLVGIQQKFEAEGDERFPIIEYATEQELVAGNDEE